MASVLALVAAPLTASAATTTAVIDFTASGYTVGAHSPDGENGWWLAKSVDFSLVDNDTVPAAGLPAGGRSLQFSNATLESGGAHLVSPTIDAAGEPSTTAPYNTFETTFTVASATGGVQPGLGVDVALDGASRYGGVVNLRHTADGLTIGSYWVPADATAIGLTDWRSAVFATVPADVPHTIRVVAVFLEDQPDSVQVFVDGVLVSAGSGVTTWEYYSTLAASGGDRSVDGISFKTSPSAPSADGIGYQAGLPAAPSTAGLGFLFTDISYGVSTSAPPLPTDPPSLPAEPDPAPDSTASLGSEETSTGEISFEASGFLPYENAYVTIFSTPAFGGWFQADANGIVRGTVVLPAGIEPGAHTLQVTGAVSGYVSAAGFAVLALAATGSDTVPLLLTTSGVLLAGGAALAFFAARRRGVTGS